MLYWFEFEFEFSKVCLKLCLYLQSCSYPCSWTAPEEENSGEAPDTLFTALEYEEDGSGNTRPSVILKVLINV